jgi:hypothetical protein
MIRGRLPKSRKPLKTLTPTLATVFCRSPPFATIRAKVWDQVWDWAVARLTERGAPKLSTLSSPRPTAKSKRRRPILTVASDRQGRLSGRPFFRLRQPAITVAAPSSVRSSPALEASLRKRAR